MLNATPTVLPIEAGCSSNTAIPRRTPLASCHPKQHPDPVSRFATVHFPDTQTDT